MKVSSWLITGAIWLANNLVTASLPPTAVAGTYNIVKVEHLDVKGDYPLTLEVVMEEDAIDNRSRVQLTADVGGEIIAVLEYDTMAYLTKTLAHTVQNPDVQPLHTAVVNILEAPNGISIEYTDKYFYISSARKAIKLKPIVQS